MPPNTPKSLSPEAGKAIGINNQIPKPTKAPSLTREISPAPKKIPEKAALLSSSPLEQKLETHRQELVKSNQAIAANKNEILKAESEQRKIEAQGEHNAAVANKEGAASVQAAVDKVLKDFPDPAFHPTPNNIQSLATIFGLTALIGETMGGQGQMSAMNALSSMNGMMQGWQQGRADLYQRERNNFTVEWDRVKAIHDRALKAADTNYKNLANDRQVALTQAKLDAASFTGVLPHYVEQGKLKEAHELLVANGKHIFMVDEALDRKRKLANEENKTLNTVAKREKTDARTTKQVTDAYQRVQGFDKAAKKLENLYATFKPEYASMGLPFGVGAEYALEAKARIGGEKNEAAYKWWSELKSMQAKDRKDLFGATLTNNEQKSWNSFNANENQAEGIIKANLEKYIREARNSANDSRTFLEEFGHPVHDYESASPAASSGAEGDDPAYEYQTLPSGKQQRRLKGQGE